MTSKGILEIYFSGVRGEWNEGVWRELRGMSMYVGFDVVEIEVIGKEVKRLFS